MNAAIPEDSIDSRSMIFRRDVRVITISCINSASTLPTCQLISVEFRLYPYPSPAALVAQYRVALWGQRRATYVHRAISNQKNITSSEQLTASLWGFLTVSSTETIRHAASTALLIALTLTRLGSQTNASKLSRTPSGPSTSTPIHFSPRECLIRSLFKMSVESRPALSQICRGIISSAFANAIWTS